MILAGLDIGTNTLRLLVAELGPSAFREIHSDRRITRLGEDLDRSGKLSNAAISRSIEALARFSDSMRNHAVSGISAVGTSALRRATNADEFIAEAKNRTGIDIRVILGEEEARLTLAGVTRALRATAEGERGAAPFPSTLVIDIGGGSTEIISQHPGRATTEASLPLGAVYLTERFIAHDPPTENELGRLRGAAGLELDKHREILHPDPNRLLAGTAGTITTLAAMELRLAKYDPDAINCFQLSREAIDAVVRKLGRSTLQERRAIPGLEPGREDIILAGAVILQEVMRRFGYTSMLVSDWGLREGIVFDMYEKITKQDTAKGTKP